MPYFSLCWERVILHPRKKEVSSYSCLRRYKRKCPMFSQSSHFLMKWRVETKPNQTEQKLHGKICKNFQLQLGKLTHKHSSSALNLQPPIFTWESTRTEQDPVLPRLNTKLGLPRPKPCCNSCSKNGLYKTGSLITLLQPQRKILAFAKLCKCNFEVWLMRWAGFINHGPLKVSNN